MPPNSSSWRKFDYSPDLRAGRADVQGPCQLWVDTLFANCSILDVGAGLGQSKARMRHNRVTTYDVDPRLRPFVDHAGGEPPAKRHDVVTCFDVIEHVEDDLRLLRMLAERAARAVVVGTPNWYVSRCQSDHHVREYTGAELWGLAVQVFPPDVLRLFGHYKDRLGSWFDPVPADAWDQHMGSKHILLALLDPDDRQRIDAFFAGRWGTVTPASRRWVPTLGEGDTIPEDAPMMRPASEVAP